MSSVIADFCLAATLSFFFYRFRRRSEYVRGYAPFTSTVKNISVVINIRVLRSTNNLLDALRKYTINTGLIATYVVLAQLLSSQLITRDLFLWIHQSIWTVFVLIAVSDLH